MKKTNTQVKSLACGSAEIHLTLQPTTKGKVENERKMRRPRDDLLGESGAATKSAYVPRRSSQHFQTSRLLKPDRSLENATLQLRSSERFPCSTATRKRCPANRVPQPNPLTSPAGSFHFQTNRLLKPDRSVENASLQLRSSERFPSGTASRKR